MKIQYHLRPKFNILSITLLSLYSLLIGSPAIATEQTADTSLYEIEIIVFSYKNTSPSEDDNEVWPTKLNFPNFAHSRALFSPYEYLMQSDLNPADYVVVPMEASDDDLTPYAEKIRNSSKYDLILHTKWRQTLEDENATKPIYISDLHADYLFQPYNPEFYKNDLNKPVVKQKTEEQAILDNLLTDQKLLNKPEEEQKDFISDLDPIVPFDDLKLLPKDDNVNINLQMGPPNHKFYGLISVFKSRFPHLDFSVYYKYLEPKAEIPEQTVTKEDNTNPLSTTDEDATVPQTSPIDTETNSVKQEIIEQNQTPLSALELKDSVRIRLNEINYFDHPKFGILARVRKYEAPPAPTEQDDTSPTQ